MKLRYQYSIVGALWALLLAPLAAILVAGFAAGASWLWLYGDSPWPESTKIFFPLTGLVAGAVVALVCLGVTARYGIAREKFTAPDSRKERVKVIISGIAPLIVVALIGVRIWAAEQSYSRSMALAAKREAEFATFAANAQKVTAIKLASGKNGDFTANVDLEGTADGTYKLDWKIKSMSFAQPLVDGTRIIDLAGGKNAEAITFSSHDLAEAYRKHLSGAGAVLVDEPFRLTVLLLPSLTQNAMNSLPPGEQKRLEAGKSALRSEISTTFPVKFTIHSDGTISR